MAKQTPEDAVKIRIAEAAKRATQEAQARRQAQNTAKPLPRELGGRPGPEPTRYGDWEKNGISSDF